MSTATAPASRPIDFESGNAKLRVSLFADYHEVWQGPVGELCANWNRAEPRPKPTEIVANVDAAGDAGIGVLVASLPEYWFSLDLRRIPTRMLRLKRTHYYQDQKTGSLYTRGDCIRGGFHWDRRGPIKATMGQTPLRTPLVQIQTGFGIDAEYTPAQLRAFAQTLLTIADDAEKYPMGPRSFCRTTRGYDT